MVLNYQVAKTRRTVLFAALLAAGILLSTQDVFAQQSIAKYEQFYGSGKGLELVLVLGNIRNILLRILNLFLLIAGLITLLTALINFISGENSGVKRMLLWGIGLLLGFGLLSVFASHGGNYSPSGGALSRAGDFNSIKQLVGGVLSVLLSIVSMVSCAVVSIHVMKGEKDGIEKLLKWFVISVIGMVLLNIF
jgi:hypothetical protein